MLLSFNSLAYRADIDGLRAIAVLSVVIYHAMPQLLPGGFVGVDIFFVISGFLITRILVADARDGHLNLMSFYERRIRRIVPALLAVVVVTLLVGYFLLYPDDYSILGESAVWTIGFIANVFFWLNTGYFDPSREAMPLLHMWSLGVEEQFYVVWPLVLFVLLRWFIERTKIMWLLLSSLFLSSFVFNIVLSETNAQAAFYLPLTRAWELGVGAMLALLPLDVMRNQKILTMVKVLPWAGILLIVYAITQLSSDMAFPSYNAMYPVIGAAFLIFSGSVSASLVNRVISITPMVFFGKISYSLYLWHWPVFVYFHHYANGSAMTSGEAIMLIFLSIILATLSWKFIELPLRYAEVSRRTVFKGAVIASIFVAILGGFIFFKDGVVSRIPEASRKLADHDTMWSWPCPEKREFDHISKRRCVLGRPWNAADRYAVLWGDSHAVHYAPLIDRVARRLGYSVLLFDSCPPYLDNEHVLRDHAKRPDYSGKCGSEYKEIISFLDANKKVDLVMLAAAWAIYPRRIHGQDGIRSEEVGLSLMDKGISRLAEMLSDRRMMVITEVPRSGKNLLPCVLSESGGILRRSCDEDPARLRVTEVQSVHGKANKVIHSLGEKFAHLSIIDTTSQMCGSELCDTFVNGEFIYRDTHHLRRNLQSETIEQIIEMIGIESAIFSTMSVDNN